MVFTNNIQYGSSGLDVTDIQERLNELISLIENNNNILIKEKPHRI